MSYWILPFILQGLIMSIDEFIHNKRQLPNWERYGHPLDTLSVLIPLLYLNVRPYDEKNLTPFVIMGIFSCLLITKDEWIHSRHCTGFESWLHSMLFILHPLCFISAAILWMNGMAALYIITLITGLFFIYQILRWSIPWKKELI